MTAVEFLESEMQKLFYITKSNKVKFDELIQQAKEMDKEQKKELINEYVQENSKQYKQENAEQYYNDTFKSE